MKICVGMGFIEDQWHSSRLHSEQLAAAVKAQLEPTHQVAYFAPELGRKPKVWDRRIGYGKRVPTSDLFHLFDPAYADCIFHLKKRQQKTLLNVTDIAFWLHRNWANTLIRRRIVAGVRAAEMRIGISRKTDHEMRSVLGFGCEEVIYLGSEPDTFQLSLADRVPGRLLHVGSVMPRKEVERIIKLLALLPEPFHFVQVGGQFTIDQQALISNLGLNRRITQHSFSPLDQLVGHYQQASALVFPSSYEGYGVPLIEARLCGTPVITSSDVPAIEVLEQDPGTKVVNWTAIDSETDQVAAQRIADELQEWIPKPCDVGDREYHSWSRVGKETVEVYSQLLGQSLGG